MSYEKDQIDSFITSLSASAAITTRLAPYVTSNSLSAAIAGINLAPYMTSNSVSLAVTTNTLTVRGTASVSATMSAGAVTVIGKPMGSVLLGHRALTGVGPWGFSGSWSDIEYMELNAIVNYQSAATATAAIYTDGGTTPVLAVRLATNIPGAVSSIVNLKIMGVSTAVAKGLYCEGYTSGGSFDNNYTATANTGFINAVKIGSPIETVSFGTMILLGWRRV